MLLEKKYEFSKGRQLWRLIPDDSGNLIIEERDAATREVYFNCLDINSGREILGNYQADEKFWIGIETVYRKIIFFHKYQKPEMPGHKGIIAFDINTGKTLWTNPELSFLLLKDEKVYCFEPLFEGRNYYVLDYKTGEILEEPGDVSGRVNALMEEENSPEKYKDYLFPETFSSSVPVPGKVKEIIEEFKGDRVIAGNIDFALTGNLFVFNGHEVLPDGKLRNLFRAVDLETGNILVDRVLNKYTETFIPDSFFIKKGLLFLLIEKVGLVVYEIKS